MHILMSILHWSGIVLLVYVVGIIVLFFVACLQEDSKTVSEIFKFGPYWLPLVVATPIVLIFAGIVEGIAAIGRSNFYYNIRREIRNWRMARADRKDRKLRDKQFEQQLRAQRRARGAR